MARSYVLRPCRKCGGPKEQAAEGKRTRRTWYCAPCGNAIYQANVVKRAVCENHPAGVWPSDCIECVRIRRERHQEACRNRRREKHLWYRPENAERFWQQRAHSLVQQAVMRGLLPSLKSGEYACVDCGGVALEYDHRDYKRPFDVEPVCRCCNKQRGTAIWPTPETFSFTKITPEQSDAA